MGQAAQQHWPVLLTCFLPLPRFLPQQKSSSTSPIPQGGYPQCCLALQEAPLLNSLGFFQNFFFKKIFFFSTDVLQQFFHTLHFSGTSVPLDHRPGHGTTCTFSSPKDGEKWRHQPGAQAGRSWHRTQQNHGIAEFVKPSKPMESNHSPNTTKGHRAMSPGATST